MKVLPVANQIICISYPHLKSVFPCSALTDANGVTSISLILENFQVHLKERMLALEEKNNLSNELASTKKRLEEIGNQKVSYHHSFSIAIAMIFKPVMH